IHRGIAARQFQRRFVLAQGIEVQGATLDNGLLHIDLVRPEIEARSRTIEIQGTGAESEAEDGGQEIAVEPHRKRT
ncbi:MAG: Hsp20 family protein, partial [Alphaproteobacteria bacterium]